MQDNNNNWIDIGKVLKPHGLRGQIKCNFQIESDLENNDQIKIQNTLYTVIGFRRQGNIAHLRLKEITTIEEADTLREQSLFLNRNKLQPHEFLLDDLKNLLILDSEKNEIGKLIKLINIPVAPVMQIKTHLQKEDLLIPFLLDKFISEISLENKYIILTDWEIFLKE